MGGACEALSIGTPVGCCFELTEYAAAASGRRMDLTVFEMDPTVRYKHKCAQRGGGSPAALIDVTGVVAPGVVGVSDQGVLVQKYGRRSHFTTGKILHVYTAANGANTIDMCTLPGLGETGHRYKIIGTAPSAFADGTPATAGGVTNPQNEPGFYNTNVKAGVIAQIVQLTNPLTNARFTNVEAETAFASLKAQNHIGPLFSAAGDSGSWIYKADGKVLGLFSKGSWEMDFQQHRHSRHGRLTNRSRLPVHPSFCVGVRHQRSSQPRQHLVEWTSSVGVC